MPEWETEYQRMLAEARALYDNELLPELVESLYLDFANAIERIVADFGTGEITAERARQLEASVIRRIADLGDRLVGDLDRSIAEAAQLAAEGHRFGMQAAASAAGVSAPAAVTTFAEVPLRALERMQQRRGFASLFRTLINRRIEDMADDVEAFTRQMVARGIERRRAGQILAKMMARDDPTLLETLQNLGPRGGRTARAIREGIEIPDIQMKQAKSILFDGYRIAVTETNHAYHEADTFAAAESPVVDLVQWTLSGRHNGLPSSPDTCDICAERNFHGYGPGIYHKRTAPPLQHPFCACSTKKILRPPDEWDNPERPIPNPEEATLEEAKRILERASRRNRSKAGGRTLTPKHVERQAGLANSSVQRSHQVATEEAVTP